MFPNFNGGVTTPIGLYRGKETNNYLLNRLLTYNIYSKDYLIASFSISF
jgi:hypothetical protein